MQELKLKRHSIQLKNEKMYNITICYILKGKYNKYSNVRLLLLFNVIEDFLLGIGQYSYSLIYRKSCVQTVYVIQNDDCFMHLKCRDFFTLRFVLFRIFSLGKVCYTMCVLYNIFIFILMVVFYIVFDLIFNL